MSSYLIFVMRCCCCCWTRVWGLLLIFLVWCLYGFFFLFIIEGCRVVGFIMLFLELSLQLIQIYFLIVHLYFVSKKIPSSSIPLVCLISWWLGRNILKRQFFDNFFLLNHQKVIKNSHQFLHSTHVVFIKFLNKFARIIIHLYIIL